MQGEDEKPESLPRAISDGVDSPEDREDDKRPTPVRMVMEGAEEDSEEGLKDTRTFHDEQTGLEWLVSVTGRSSSGILPLRTVPLLELTFAQADEPAQPRRQVLGHGSDLADISDQDLLSLFHRSEPYKEPISESEGQERKGRKGKTGGGNPD